MDSGGPSLFRGFSGHRSSVGADGDLAGTFREPRSAGELDAAGLCPTPPVILGVCQLPRIRRIFVTRGFILRDSETRTAAWLPLATSIHFQFQNASSARRLPRGPAAYRHLTRLLHW